MTPFQEVRQYMRSGDTILWASSTVLGWLIRKFSKADVNHASTVIKFDTVDRVMIAEALSKGIELHSLSKRIEEFKGKIYWLPLMDEYDFARPGTKAWALYHIDVGYDYSDLFKQTRTRVMPDSKKLFCSEFDFLAKRDGGCIERLNGVKYAPRPGDMESLGIYKERIQVK